MRLIDLLMGGSPAYARMVSDPDRDVRTGPRRPRVELNSVLEEAIKDLYHYYNDTPTPTRTPLPPIEEQLQKIFGTYTPGPSPTPRRQNPNDIQHMKRVNGKLVPVY